MLITDIWHKTEGNYFCVATKSSSGFWKDHYFARNELGKVRNFLKDNADKNLYWCPHGLKEKSRKEESAVMPKMLWADLDEADPRKMSPKPTIAIESSPGRYVGLWLVDAVVDKELNAALTYHVGADKGGWDPGQVLRIPGTINYKYPNQPKTRVLWDNEPVYKIDSIRRKVKDSIHRPAGSTNASEIYEKYERKFPVWLRRELLRKDPPKSGKRSEMIWKIEHALLEAGCEKDEAFYLIKASLWNKFKGRRNEDDQLKREMDKIVGSHFKSHDTIESPTKSYQFLAHPIEDAEERNIDWLWRGRLALGELTIVEGDPGLGKSYFVQMTCLHLCDATALPDMRPGDLLEPRKIAYFDIENDQGAVTKPRLIDNGLKNTHLFFQEDLPFSVDDPDALEGVENAIERLRPSVVVFDTLNNYIGSIDTHKGSEVQQSMMWFRTIARQYHCAVIVLRHLTKSSKEKALYRGQGSIAFTGVARIVLTVGISPDDDEERVVAVNKMNIAKPPRSLTFKISSLPDRKGKQDRSKFEFGGLTDHTADDIVNVVRTSDKPKERDEAVDFLKDVLGDGATEVQKIETMAEKRNISKRTLHRAAEDLQVTKTRRGFGKQSSAWWELADAGA